MQCNPIPSTLLGAPFPARLGPARRAGQTADVGKLAGLGGTFHVEEVQKFGGYVLHIGELRDGVLRVGEGLTGSVDYDRREKARWEPCGHASERRRKQLHSHD